MSLKKFIFNIIINKLQLNDKRYTNIKNPIVKFKFDDIQFDIPKSCLNATDFDEEHSRKFSSTWNDLKCKLKCIPFELTLLKPSNEEKNSSELPNSPSQKILRLEPATQKPDSVTLNNVKEKDTKEVAKTKTLEKIGIASCSWPHSLIHKLEDDCFSPIPHIQVCEIHQNGKLIGNITVAIMLHCKCDEETLKANLANVQTLNDEEIVTIFQNIRESLNKTDALFDMENESAMKSKETVAGACKISENCFEKHGPRLDTSRYKLLRGTLVKDCQVFESKKYNGKAAEMTRRQTKERTKDDDSATSECSCFCCRNEESSTSSECFSDQDSDKEECPKMRTIYQSINPSIKTKPLPQRFCPKCCQNLTFTAIQSPCPKCGYTMPEKRVHLPNETADDILRQWDSDEEARQKRVKSRKIDSCSCEKQINNNEYPKKCLHCRIKEICSEVNNMNPCAKLAHKSKECNQDRSEKEKKSDEINENKLCDPKRDPTDEMTVRNYQFQEPKAVFVKATNSNEPINSKCIPKPTKNLTKMEKNKINKKREATPCIAQSSAEKRVQAIVENLCKEKPWEQLILIPKVKSVNKICKRNRRRYCYPKRMPRFVDDHDQCVPDKSHVPSTMGWLWNRSETGRKKGWRPGTISRPVRELMSYFLTEYPVDTLLTTQEAAALVRPPLEPEPEEELKQRPTLRIQRKNGEYMITMHPLRTDKELQFSADPYAKVDPIQFKVVKDPLVQTKQLIKRFLRLIGFKKCACQRSLYDCTCRPYGEKLRFLESLKDICRALDVPSQYECLDLTDTTDTESQLDMEFTPPAGIIKPHLLRKPDAADECTQYDENDYNFCAEQNSVGQPVDEAKKKKREICPGPIITTPCQVLEEKPKKRVALKIFEKGKPKTKIGEKKPLKSTKEAKQETREVKDSKQTKDTKDAKKDAKEAKKDSKEVKNDTKQVKRDSKETKKDTTVVKDPKEAKKVTKEVKKNPKETKK